MRLQRAKRIEHREQEDTVASRSWSERIGRPCTGPVFVTILGSMFMCPNDVPKEGEADRQGEEELIDANVEE